MTVGQLKEIIRDLPDDMIIVHWNEMVPVDVESAEVQRIFPLNPEKEALVIS